MTLNEFIYRANLRPGDGIVVNMKLLGFLDHYVIYVGVDRGKHILVANMSGSGVKVLTPGDLDRLLPKITLNRVRYFQGNEHQRQVAVQRAINLIGRQGYNLFSANCEHFANFVQNGTAYSRQSKIVGQAGLVLGGLALLGYIFGEDGDGEEEDYV